MTDERNRHSQDSRPDGASEPSHEDQRTVRSHPPSAASEPTAAELLADPDLAPELARKVLAFFAEDGELELPVKDTRPRPSAPSEKRAAEQRARLETLLEHADVELLDRLQADRSLLLRADASGFSDRAVAVAVKREPKLPLRIRPIELVDWNQPEEIEDALRDNTPQALLRDLHRPVFDFDPERETHVLPSIADRIHRQAVDRAFTTTRELRDAATAQFGRDALEHARDAMRVVRRALDEEHRPERQPDDDGDASRDPT